MYSVESGCFTEEYLRWVIEHFGADQLIQSTNCNSVPRYPGDYCITYGTATELLESLQKGIRTHVI